MKEKLSVAALLVSWGICYADMPEAWSEAADGMPEVSTGSKELSNAELWKQVEDKKEVYVVFGATSDKYPYILTYPQRDKVGLYRCFMLNGEHKLEPVVFKPMPKSFIQPVARLPLLPIGQVCTISG